MKAAAFQDVYVWKMINQEFQLISFRKTDRLDWLSCIIITGVWLVSAIVVNPLGDFPLNDDWAWGWTVKNLVETHSFRFHDFQAMTLISQTIYGALFCLPFGFSFTALRISTLIAGLVGLWGTYFLLRRVGTNTWTALLGALTLAACPIFFALSCTFMTDVPFTTMFVFSTFFFVCSIQSDRPSKFLVAATLCACTATFIRQLGIAVPIGYAITVIICERKTLRTILQAIWPAVITVGALVLFNSCLEYFDIVPLSYGTKQKDVLVAFQSQGVIRVFLYALFKGAFLCSYVALFSLPFSLLFFHTKFAGKIPKRLFRTSVTMAVISLSIFLLVYFSMGAPFLGNILRPSGVGPISIGIPDEIPYVKQIMIAFGVLGLGNLFWDLFIALFHVRSESSDTTSSHRRLACFFIITIVIYLTPALLIKSFDRYVLPIIPLTMAATICFAQMQTETQERITRGLHQLAGTIILIAAYLSFSVLGTHDYLATERSMWAAVRWLTDDKHVSPKVIGGGFAVTGFHLPDQKIPSSWFIEMPDGSVRQKPMIPPHDDPSYLFGTTNCVPGFLHIKTFHCNTWLKNGHKQIFVIEKEHPDIIYRSAIEFDTSVNLVNSAQEDQLTRIDSVIALEAANRLAKIAMKQKNNLEKSVHSIGIQSFSSSNFTYVLDLTTP
jgi:hypothetical protein